MSVAPRQGLNARQTETVERLLTAGVEELAAVGHEALTIRTVAARAGVSTATAYTYLASKNHLYAELFWRHLRTHPMPATPAGVDATQRLTELVRFMARLLSDSPELAAAATRSLLATDPDVDRLRAQIGAEFVARFRTALGDDTPADTRPAVLEALQLAFSGAMLQAGMGFYSYLEMGERLADVVAAVMKGNA